jgi:hypothetical protein
MGEKGCDLELVLYLLAGCTHPDANDSVLALKVKTQVKEQLGHLQRLDRQMQRMQETLEALKADPVISKFQPISIELPRVLCSAREYLASPVLRRAFNLRENKIPTGLTQIALCLYMQRVTGSSSYSSYPLLADLLEAGYEAHGITRVVEPDSLARRVRRFKKDHPELAEVLGRFFLGGR